MRQIIYNILLQSREIYSIGKHLDIKDFFKLQDFVVF